MDFSVADLLEVLAADSVCTSDDFSKVLMFTHTNPKASSNQVTQYWNRKKRSSSPVPYYTNVS